MAQHLETGKKGEEAAAAFLVEKGYEILERNYHFRHAEIDIIAKKNKILIFAEVKTRVNLSYGFPEEFVDATKRRLIMKVAEHFIFDRDWHGDIRFDIISVIINQNEIRIKQLEDAFY
ncbi:MAG: YraN family protein [Spirosomaceae bacterium]|jgi:putative endonuclease|nr:YraN family protein [Spirosomataceae bacterium]